jgi:hypothetical protein
MEILDVSSKQYIPKSTKHAWFRLVIFSNAVHICSIATELMARWAGLPDALPTNPLAVSLSLDSSNKPFLSLPLNNTYM